MPDRLRVDGLADADTLGHGRLDVGPDAGSDAAEERRAVRGALLHLGQLEREAEHRRDDPEPQAAPRRSPRDAPDLRLDAEAADQLERVAQAVGDALQDR